MKDADLLGAVSKRADNQRPGHINFERDLDGGIYRSGALAVVLPLKAQSGRGADSAASEKSRG